MLRRSNKKFKRNSSEISPSVHSDDVEMKNLVPESMGGSQNKEQSSPASYIKATAAGGEGSEKAQGAHPVVGQGDRNDTKRPKEQGKYGTWMLVQRPQRKTATKKVDQGKNKPNVSRLGKQIAGSNSIEEGSSKSVREEEDQIMERNNTSVNLEASLESNNSVLVKSAINLSDEESRGQFKEGNNFIQGKRNQNLEEDAMEEDSMVNLGSSLEEGMNNIVNNSVPSPIESNYINSSQPVIGKENFCEVEPSIHLDLRGDKEKSREYQEDVIPSSYNSGDSDPKGGRNVHRQSDRRSDFGVCSPYGKQGGDGGECVSPPTVHSTRVVGKIQSVVRDGRTDESIKGSIPEQSAGNPSGNL
uniref:Uncharacterized protein n=1 Tax=Chenopodium quinoa TaxID=63459 RepID=A0A803N3N7_CHEQI